MAPKTCKCKVTLNFLRNTYLKDTRPKVWKIQDFSVIQILREINFGEFRSSITAYFANLGALNFDFSVNFRLRKTQKIHEYKNLRDS